ncbi:hypothetical protein OIP52_000719 [Salmonella enterica]|nr:hypothetical protein [Salmonella enterica]
MFNVKRNGLTVDITNIPSTVPVGVFKNIADETGATGCLSSGAINRGTYTVSIPHTDEHMASAVAWLALEEKEKLSKVNTNAEKLSLDMIPPENKNINSEIKAYLCTECREKRSAHVFARLPEKSWTKEQLDEWKANRNKEDMLADLYILRTRTGLAELIEKLHTIDERFAKAPVSGGFMQILKRELRGDVKEVSANLLSLI